MRICDTCKLPRYDSLVGLAAPQCMCMWRQNTTPPKREWVGLTDEEIQEFGYAAEKFDASNSEWFDRWGFARAIEAKLKEKNK